MKKWRERFKYAEKRSIIPILSLILSILNLIITGVVIPIWVANHQRETEIELEKIKEKTQIRVEVATPVLLPGRISNKLRPGEFVQANAVEIHGRIYNIGENAAKGVRLCIEKNRGNPFVKFAKHIEVSLSPPFADVDTKGHIQESSERLVIKLPDELYPTEIQKTKNRKTDGKKSKSWLETLSGGMKDEKDEEPKREFEPGTTAEFCITFTLNQEEYAEKYLRPRYKQTIDRLEKKTKELEEEFKKIKYNAKYLNTGARLAYVGQSPIEAKYLELGDQEQRLKEVVTEMPGQKREFIPFTPYSLLPHQAVRKEIREKIDMLKGYTIIEENRTDQFITQLTVEAENACKHKAELRRTRDIDLVRGEWK